MTDDSDELPERTWYLVLLALGPAVWAIHFVVTYATVSVWCARLVERSGSVAPVRSAVIWYTAGARVAIVLIGWSGYKRHSYGGQPPPHEEDTAGDRHRFLGLATALLAGLSAIATMFVGYSAMFFETCW